MFSIVNFLTICFLLVLCVYGEKKSIKEEFASKNNDFGIRLYKALLKENKDNLVFSSHSSSIILALVSLGARDKTANQIKSVLGFNISNEEIKEDFKDVIKNMNHVDQIEIKTANKAYIAEGFVVEPNFLKIATEYFDSGIQNVDFNTSKKTADTINSWVEHRTNNKIKNLINENKINEHTRLILVSALYFEGEWQNAFNLNATKVADFFVSKQKTVKVPMMETTGHFLVYRNDEMKVTGLILPYENPKVQFCMFLPDDIDGLPQVEEKAEELWKIRNFTQKYIKLYLPKFQIESTLEIMPALKDMGIENLFSKADLTGITKEPIFVSSVNHKTYVDVNERGTGVAFKPSVHGEKGVQPELSENVEVFIANHPFGFIILYEGVSLIVGRFVHL